jgi:DNA-binding FadR family transcriptional regulator
MPGVTQQVESYYRSLLDRLAAGMRLPSERAVMSDLQVSRTTIRLVLTKLEAEKLLTPVHGKGYYKL